MKVAVVALICFFFLIDPLVSATEEKENAPMSVQNDVVDLFRRADAIVQPPDAPTLALEIVTPESAPTGALSQIIAADPIE
ncbi:unnamed protein product, partial [Mesorhabditis belari]|uniref:Uncharacterized protein n=1 Tax=Mesorhabditis belari TaxID=2138241 RepID=A0AAF3FJZ9_9BILA